MREAPQLERWQTAGDLRVCIPCWRLNNQIFPEGAGPRPIISTHAKCRCVRVPLEFDGLPGHVQSEMRRITKRTLKQYTTGKPQKNLRAAVGRAFDTALANERRRTQEANDRIIRGLVTTSIVGAAAIAEEIARRRQ